MANPPMIFEIEVAYASKDAQKVITIAVKKGTTVLEAIQASGILFFFPEITDLKNRVGIYGKTVKLESIVKPNDRVEIYRNLFQDPKEARRKKAELQSIEHKKTKMKTKNVSKKTIL